MNEKYRQKADEAYDLHEKLVLGLEEYRKLLGGLEEYAETPAAKAILATAHHFILNGLSNLLYAQREALIRAGYAEKKK